MKLILNKRYEELVDIEEKYKYLNGKMFTIAIGGRSRSARLLQLQKEELVRIIFDLVNDIDTLKILYKVNKKKGE